MGVSERQTSVRCVSMKHYQSEIVLVPMSVLFYDAFCFSDKAEDYFIGIANDFFSLDDGVSILIN